ncbi:MAG TPA: hypothetical protein VIV14_08260 [Gammaproteobacteria bacterium]
MGFLSWLEQTAYSEWIVAGLVGWPLMLSMHTVGISLIVGTALAANLRLLGFFKPIPITSLRTLMGIGWFGIGLNVFSGVSLFMAQATFYVTSPPFLVKITFIVLGIANLHHTQKVLKAEAGNWDSSGVPRQGLILGAAAITFWTLATLTGRLIAYL